MPAAEIFVANVVVSAVFLCLTWAGLVWEARIESRVGWRHQPDKDNGDDITHGLHAQIPSAYHYVREYGIDSFPGADTRAYYADEPGPSAPRFRKPEQVDDSQPPSDTGSGDDDTGSEYGSEGESDEGEPRTDESEDDKRPKRKRRKQAQKAKHRRMKKPYHHKKPPTRKEAGHGKNQNQRQNSNQSQRQGQSQKQKRKPNQNARPSDLRGGGDDGVGPSLDMFDHDPMQLDRDYDTGRVSDQLSSIVRGFRDDINRIVDSMPSPAPKPPVTPRPKPISPRPWPTGGPKGPRPFR